MTRGQRRLHLLVWLVLPVGLIGLTLWAVSVRPSAPTTTTNTGATP